MKVEVSSPDRKTDVRDRVNILKIRAHTTLDQEALAALYMALISGAIPPGDLRRWCRMRSSKVLR